jgi:hypothetical protein
MVRLWAMAALLGVVAFGGPAHAQTGTITINLSRTQTGLGIVNTELMPLGTLLVRERGASVMTQLDTLDILPEQMQRPQSAGLISVTIAKGVNVGVSLGFWSPASAASIAAEAKRNMRFYVKDVTTERLKSPLAVLNSPALKSQRAFYASFYGDDYVYELVFDVKRVNEGGIGFGRPFKVDGRLGFPQGVRLQGVQLSVAYDSSSALEFGGNQAPMFYRTQTYRLVKAGDDYRFVPDTGDDE